MPKFSSNLAAIAAGALAMTNPVTSAAHEASPAAPPAGQAITASGPEGDLAGTMIAPADGKPLVLIIPGSGPTDRDGNNPLGVSAASYRLLAEGLAARGIGSLRIDKRGMFASGAAVADANAVTIADYVSDVAAWRDAAAAQMGAECIWLAGHSEGGLVALAAADTLDGICGLILLASPGQSAGDILRKQLQANPANIPILPQALPAIDALERGERVDISDMHPALAGLFAPAVQGFLIDLMAQDPAATAARIEIPMLIVQGAEDLQIGVENGEALHDAQPASTLVVLPGVNHVLKTVGSGSRAANLAAYADPHLPIASGVVEAVADFVAADFVMAESGAE